MGRSGPTAAETAVLQPIVEAMIAGHPGGGAVQLQLPVLSQQGPSGTQGSVTVRAALAYAALACERSTPVPDPLSLCARQGRLEWSDGAAGVAILVSAGGGGAEDLAQLSAERATLREAGMVSRTIYWHLGRSLPRVPAMIVRTGGADPGAARGRGDGDCDGRHPRGGLLCAHAHSPSALTII